MLWLRERLEGSKQSLLLNGLVAYGVFGALQVLTRLYWGWRTSSRMRQMLKDMPATNGKGHDQPAGWIADNVANLERHHDWRREICEGVPIAKQLGFSWFPGPYLLLINDPAIVRHILKDEFNKYSKSDTTVDPFFFYLKEFLGDGIFIVKHGVGAEDSGKDWNQMRKVSSQIFSRKNFNTKMQEVFVSKSEQLRKFLQKQGDKPVDIQACFFNFTFDSIMDIFFGEQSNTAEGVPNVYGKAFDRANVCTRIHANSSLAAFFMCSAFLPWPFGGAHGGLARALWDWCSPLYRELKRCCKILDSESNRLVRKAQEDPNLADRRDLLALFLQGGFTPEFTKQMVFHLIIAGRDTTAGLLSFMAYELARNPEVQEKLHQEIMQKLPPQSSLDWKSLSATDMPYLNGVIYETLRLWPPVPLDPKMAFEDDVVPGGFTIPKWSTIAYVPYAMGRDATRYPEPLAFRPERWIPFTPPAHHEFPVFQAGPRICLGMDMALFEAKTITVELLRFLRFEMVEGQKVSYGDKITLDIKSNGKDEFMVRTKPWDDLKDHARTRS